MSAMHNALSSQNTSPSKTTSLTEDTSLTVTAAMISVADLEATIPSIDFNTTNFNTPHYVGAAMNRWAQRNGYLCGIATYFYTADDQGNTTEYKGIFMPLGAQVIAADAPETELIGALGSGFQVSDLDAQPALWTLAAHRYALQEGYVAGWPTWEVGSGVRGVLLFGSKSGIQVSRVATDSLRSQDLFGTAASGDMDNLMNIGRMTQTWCQVAGTGAGAVPTGGYLQRTATFVWGPYNSTLHLDWQREVLLFPHIMPIDSGGIVEALLEQSAPFPAFAGDRLKAYQLISQAGTAGSAGSGTNDIRSLYTLIGYPWNAEIFEPTSIEMSTIKYEENGISKVDFMAVMVQIHNEVRLVSAVNGFATAQHNALNLSASPGTFGNILDSVFTRLQLAEESTDYTMLVLDILTNLVFAGLSIGIGQVTKVAAQITLEITLALVQEAVNTAKTAAAGSGGIPATVEGAYADLKDGIVSNYTTLLNDLQQQIQRVLSDWAKLQALGNACLNGTVLTDWGAFTSLSDDLQNQARLGFYQSLLPYIWAVGCEPDVSSAQGSGHRGAPQGTAWGVRVYPSAEEDVQYVSFPNGYDSIKYNGPYHAYYLYGTSDGNKGYPTSALMDDLASLGVLLSDLLAGSAGWEAVPAWYWWTRIPFTNGETVLPPEVLGA